MTAFTFTTDQNWDEVAAPAMTGSDTITLQDSAKLTIRTDTRWHPYAPGGMVGSLSTLTATDGEFFFDGTSVRWLEINGGAGSPAFGDTISQGAVSGTYLGFWADKTSAPTLALGAVGFIKLLSVSGGTFAAGALTFSGAGAANATSADVPGWIEIVVNDAVAFGVPRLGKHKARGDWFQLEDTTGIVGQQLQVPTNGGGQNASGYDVPTDCGAWIEDAPGAGTYEFYPALADFLQTGTYTWAANHVSVTLTAHAYQAGDWIYLTFTSGGAVGSSGWYEIVVVNTTAIFSVYLAGSGAGGNVDMRSPAKNGWGPRNLGAPRGNTDRRQNFVRDCGNGKLQISENFDYACTYTTRAQKTGTYTVQTHASTYTWSGDTVYVTYLTGHLLESGHEIYADFTSGDAVGSSGLYTITVEDPYRYSFPLPGSGAGGNVTARVGCYFAIAAHVMGVNDVIYCTFTGGSAVTGSYRIYSVAGATNFSIAHAPVAGVTGGSVSVEERMIIKMPFTNTFSVGNRVLLDFGAGVTEEQTIIYPNAPVAQASTYTWAAGIVTVTFASHGRLVGDWVRLYFTSGGATAHGSYQILTVPGTGSYTVALAGSGAGGNVIAQHGSFDVNKHSGGTGASGNVTVRFTVGNTPVAGCKTRVPNIFLRSCTTGTRNKNTVHDTLGTRPDYGTGIQGEIDLENVCSTWYYAVANAYSVRLQNLAYLDVMSINNTVTTTNFDNIGNGCKKASVTAAEYVLYFLYCTGGVAVQNSKFQRGGNVVASGHVIYTLSNINMSFTDCTCGFIQYARSSTYPLYIYYSSNVTVTRLTSLNGYSIIASGQCDNVSIYDTNYVDRYIGYTNQNNASYCISISSGSTNVLVDGMTFGWGLLQNVCSCVGLVQVSNTINITVRNIGTKASPVPINSFRPNWYTMAYLVTQSGGATDNIRLQRVHTGSLRTALLVSSLASDYNAIYQNCSAGMYNIAAQAIAAPTMLSCNANIRGCRSGVNSVTGQVACYGTHFMDQYISDNRGRFFLMLNEPTPDTAYQVTVVSGSAKWTGLGNLGLRGLGDQVIIEDSHFRIGHTGFENVAPTLTGTNTGNHSYEYQIDTGSGYSGVWQVLNGANLSAEVVDPAIGFKMKWRLTCTVASLTNALTCIRVDTTSSAAAQLNLYPYEDYTLDLEGLPAGTKVAFVEHGTETLLQDVQTESSGAVRLNFTSDDSGDFIDIVVLCAGYDPYIISNYELQTNDVVIPVSLNTCYGYNPIAAATVTFDGATHLITMGAGITTLNVEGLFKVWVDWALTGNNLRYFQALFTVGGNDIDALAGTSIPVYAYLRNGWKIRPDEANHTLSVTVGVLLVDGGGDPFVDTLGAFTVRVNYEQPVQAITVATGGLTAADVWSYIDRKLTDAGIVRTELATELGRIDVATSTRLATLDYTAPDNATISAIDAKTTNLPADPASNTVVNTRLAASSYVAPDNAGIGTASANTTQLLLDVAIVDGNVDQSLLDLATIDGNVDQLLLDVATVPTAEENADAVRLELATELAHINADIDSRMATFTYTAPDNATIGLINAKTTNLPADPASTSDISALHDFDPAVDTVNIGAVAGAPVTSVDDFKADVSLLATELNATANKEDIIDAIEDIDTDVLGKDADAYLDQPGTAGYYLARSANERGVVTAVDDLEIHVSGLPAIDHLYDNRVIQLVNITDPTLMETHVVVRYEDDGGVVLDAPLVHTVVPNEWYAIMLPVIDIYTEFTIDESYCIVFGVIKDVHGHPVPNTELLFKPLSVTQIIGNAVLSTRPKSVYTDSTGAFYLRLLRNAQVLAICQAISMRKTITVPNSPAVNIEDT